MVKNGEGQFLLKLLDPDPKKLKDNDLNKVIKEFKFIITNINK